MSRSGNTDSTRREATGGFVLFCVFVCLFVDLPKFKNC